MVQDQVGEYDAIVVGSVPGGATVGRELSRAGRRVLILERGKDDQDLGSYLTAMRVLDAGRFSAVRMEGGRGAAPARKGGGVTGRLEGTLPMERDWARWDQRTTPSLLNVAISGSA